MKIFKTTLTVATALGATLVAMPAAAQVNGIAVSNPNAVILSSKARVDAYQQISQTYQTQLQQVNALRQEVNTLEVSLDTNSDGQLTQAETQANPSVVTQIEQKRNQIITLFQPIAMAQAYAIEQVVADFPNATNQVIQQKNIQILLNPDVIQYAPDSADVTSDIVAALDQRMPSVQTTPPADWRPRQQTIALQQRLQEIIMDIAQQQAIAAARQQQQTAQPQATPQPTGR